MLIARDSESANALIYTNQPYLKSIHCPIKKLHTIPTSDTCVMKNDVNTFRYANIDPCAFCVFINLLSSTIFSPLVSQYIGESHRLYTQWAIE